MDEVRLWAGTALNTTQLDAEDLSTAPASPNFRYTFATDASNIGSTSGNNGTPTNGVFLCGDNLAYGPPLTAFESDHAFPMTWDGVGAISITTIPGASNILWTG